MRYWLIHVHMLWTRWERPADWKSTFQTCMYPVCVYVVCVCCLHLCAYTLPKTRGHRYTALSFSVLFLSDSLSLNLDRLVASKPQQSCLPCPTAPGIELHTGLNSSLCAFTASTLIRDSSPQPFFFFKYGKCANQKFRQNSNSLEANFFPHFSSLRPSVIGWDPHTLWKVIFT